MNKHSLTSPSPNILDIPSGVLKPLNITPTTLRLFGQTLIPQNNNPDDRIYHRIKRKKQPLPHSDAKRRKIAASTTNRHQDLSTKLTLFDQSWIANDPHLYPPYVPGKEPVVVVEYEPSVNISVPSTNVQDEILSTELNLLDESWIAKYPHLYRPYVPRKKDGLALLEAERAQVIAANLIRMRLEGNENDLRGASTDPKLYEYPWKIRKKLEASDVGHMTRLLLGKEVVKNHILNFFTREVEERIRSNGLNVEVCDVDTNINHCYTMKLKHWSSSNSFVFIGGWSRDFVKRRNLKQGDEIGLYWDQFYSRFYFTLLKRAN